MPLSKAFGIAKGWPMAPGQVAVAAAVTLGALTLSGSLQIGVAASGTISGATSGSTITSNIPGITVNSGARTYSGTPTGSAATISNGLVETLAAATNSPVNSSVVVAAAGPTLPVLAPYLGQVATRSYSPNKVTGTNTTLMSRTLHTARDSVTALQLEFANRCIDSTTGYESQSSGNMSITASIEYPLGNIVGQVLWSGVATGTIAPGEHLLSDALAVVIPSGAQFAVLSYSVNAAAGVPYATVTGNGFKLTGEALESGTTVVDKTLSGTITDNGAGGLVFPSAIVATTTKPSFLLIGDSRTQGYGDTATGDGDVGEIARSIGPTCAYINSGISSDRAMYRGRVAGFNRRVATYVSHVISELGAADTDSAAGRTAAQTIASLQNLYSQFPTKTVIQSTTTPITTGTWSGSGGAGQTRNAGYTEQNTVNDWIRTTPAPLAAYLEVADVVMTARNSGYWNANYTADGRHANVTGYTAILSAGVINAITLANLNAPSHIWTPHELNLNHAWIWLKADDAGTTTSGAAWTPRNNTATTTQGTSGNQPALTAAAVNGKTAMRFDGTNDYLAQSPSLRGLINGASYITYMAAFVPQTMASFGTLMDHSTNASANTTRVGLSYEGSTNKVKLTARRANADTLTTLDSTTALTPATPIIAIGEFNGPTGAVSVRVNGAADGSTTLATTGAFPANDSLGGNVGAFTTASGFFKGDIYELMQVFSRLLTAGEKEQCEGYMAHAIGAPLPPGHPYFAAPPTV